MRTKAIIAACLAGFVFANSAVANSLYSAVPVAAPAPVNNPTTPAKVELGKKLYFDPRLSADGTVSCNSCHNVMAGGEDNRPTSVGIRGQKGGRSAPTVWNAAFMSVQFWDGRAASLEDQAKGPLTNPIEMGMKDHDAVIRVVNEIPEYRAEFAAAFPEAKDPVNIDNLARSIAAFERTLITSNGRFDRFLNGDQQALSKEEKRGYELVQTTGCVSCHSGVNFAGPALPGGTGFFQRFPMFESNKYVKQYRFKDDAGRFAVTKKAEDRHMWRVPGWRNIALTAPYFHNGSVASLDEAVRVMAKTQLDKELPAEDVKVIVAFLGSLTGEFPRVDMPRLPATPGYTVSGKKPATKSSTRL